LRKKAEFSSIWRDYFRGDSTGAQLVLFGSIKKKKRAVARPLA
jgi:hypothetical protein